MLGQRSQQLRKVGQREGREYGMCEETKHSLT